MARYFLTNYKSNPSLAIISSTSDSLAEELNHFFARFDINTNETELLPFTDSLAPSVSTAEVRKVLRNVNPRRATGPDGIPGRVLRDCADQLTEVFCNIFNLSLSTCTVPNCLISMHTALTGRWRIVSTQLCQAWRSITPPL